ncbi:MAG TPA: hypothetical protein PKI15_10265, partial [Candidatus Cloacimonadota bacterium]|nr:hypothetical protein [Candidatus Cloacimonadota bacterium]
NTNISVVIDGMNVTFTATEDWFGSEVITFSVFDGYAYAYDTVTVDVNLVSLGTPTISSVTRTAGGVTLTWETIRHANAYRVYRCLAEPNGAYELLGTVTEAQFTDASDNPKAFYYIQAVYLP